jgi:hypothetical protein
MKQSDDHKAFFEKFGFNLTCNMKHPDSKEPMNFEGWEAKYVSTLEHKVEQLEKYLGMQNEKIDWLMNRDMYLIKQKLSQTKED